MADQTLEVTQGGWQATPAQYAQAVAAATALQAGEDPIAAAKAVAADKDGDTVQRYLIAVCRLGHGDFTGLTDADLYDVAALVPLRMQDFDGWKKIRGA